MKKIISLFFTVIFFLSLFPFSSFAAGDGVVDELSAATTGDEAFSFMTYPKNALGQASVITFSEVGFGTGNGYALYVYIYNPTEAPIIVNGQNKIAIATSFDSDGTPMGYEKFDLETIDISSGDYENRFIKFKIKDKASSGDGFSLYQRAALSSSERKYFVSEVELHYIGDANATAIDVGKVYSFTGTGNSLRGSVGDILTVQLDVESAYWRSDTNALGHQDQISSVYFAVPNNILNEYGYLTRVKATWNEQKLQPMIVTTSQTLYNQLSPYAGVNVGTTYNSSIPNGFAGEDVDIDTHFGSAYEHKVDFAYNKNRLEVVNSPAHYWTASNRMSVLPAIFKTDYIETGHVSVPKTVLKSYVQTHKNDSWMYQSSVDSGRTKGQQTVTINLDDTFDLTSYKEANGWFAAFLRYTLSSRDVNQDESYKNIPPIYEVKQADYTGSDYVAMRNNLYLSSEDVVEFQHYCQAATRADKTTYLFRFAVTDYSAQALTLNNSVNDGTAYGAEQTVFLDFDIIELTFYKTGIYTTVPVVMSPVDIVAGISDPAMPQTNKFNLSILGFIAGLIVLFVGAAVIIYYGPKLYHALNKLFGAENGRRRRE